MIWVSNPSMKKILIWGPPSFLFSGFQGAFSLGMKWSGRA